MPHIMDRLLADIKHNCDISDAVYWGYFSICGLLMRYRDLFRSEHRLDPWSAIPRQDIATWIEQKESRWPELEGRAFRQLTIEGRMFDPFDADGVNAAVGGRGIVYGAGYGTFLKPTFFLASIAAVSEIDGHRVYTTDRELVRDLFTSPAMLRERTITIRRDPLRALLWDLYTQLRSGGESIMAEAFVLHGLEPGCSDGYRITDALERMAGAYAGVLLRHELAESQESLPAWKGLLAAGLDRKAEHFLRAVQDLIADTSAAGPLRNCVENRDRRGLALAVGLMERYRSSLVPELRSAYRRFRENGDWMAVERTRTAVFDRFQAVRRSALGHFDPHDPATFGMHLQKLMLELS